MKEINEEELKDVNGGYGDEYECKRDPNCVWKPDRNACRCHN